MIEGFYYRIYAKHFLASMLQNEITFSAFQELEGASYAHKWKATVRFFSSTWEKDGLAAAVQT